MKILEVVGVKKEELERTYQKLIEAQIYYELVKRGKIKPEEITDIINSQDRTKAGKTLPAHGLYLLEVNY